MNKRKLLKYKKGDPIKAKSLMDAEEVKPEEVDKAAMEGMMKAKIATEAHYGNPSAKRMVSPNPLTYDFKDGRTGTHFMGSIDNYAVPTLQEKEGKLVMMDDMPPPSKEDIRLNSEADADYFAKNYKDVAPMMYGRKKKGGILYSNEK
jgi:hypothetical protein